MENLRDLVALIREATFRSQAWAAIRRLMLNFPGDAEAEIDALLSDPAVSDRAKAIALYYLEEFRVLTQLSEKHRAPLNSLIQGIAEDVDRETEEGRDPFAVGDHDDDQDS